MLALLLANTAKAALLSSGSSQVPRRELALQAQVTQAVSRTGTQLASLLGAIAVVLCRRLSGGYAPSVRR